MQDYLRDAQKRYQVNSGYVVRQLADEFLLIPVKLQEAGEPQMAIMNETGQFLWKQLQNGCTVEALLRTMMEEYQVSEEEAMTDIMEFLQDLKERKLLQESRGE